MPGHERYPAVMYHPSDTPAVISDDYAEGNNPRVDYRAPPGAPRKFPPVTVNNRDQEEYYISRGYNPVGGDPEAFERAMVAPLPQDYTHQEYPRIVNGLVDQGPDAPKPVDREYPKWVTPPDGDPVIVNSRIEEDAVMRGSTKNEPAQASETELECVALILAAAEQDDEPSDLAAQAKELGIKVDGRWSKSRLQSEIDKALAA